MWNQYQTVRDFDLYDLQKPIQPRFSPLVFRKQDFALETKDNDHTEQSENSIFYQRKLLKSRLETSFHAHLLNPHVESFQKNFLFFLLKSYPQLKSLPKSTLLWRVYGQDLERGHSMQKLIELVRKDSKYFEEKQKNIFLSQLFYEESLSQFLSLVCNNTHSQIGLELAFVASLFCQLYRQKQQQNMTQHQIQKTVDEALESEDFDRYVQKLQFLSLRRARIEAELEESSLRENTKKLMRVLGNTILLVIEQYFTNKFSKEEQAAPTAKRGFTFRDISNDQYSQDEDQVCFQARSKKQKS